MEEKILKPKGKFVRKSLSLITLAVLSMWSALVQSSASANEQTPNILLILADDLGYADLSVHGQQQFSTPNIDTIFDNGVRFTQAYVTNSVCAPSRAGLLTGRMGSRFGFEANLPHKYAEKPGSRIGLDPAQKTMADVLKLAGYKTMAIGKWHLGDNDELFHPNVRGFDEFFGITGGSRSYFKLNSYDKLKSLQDNGTYITENADMYITETFTDKALELIDTHTTENPDKPFFMYMSYTAPHEPMHAKQSDLDRVPDIVDSKRRTYAAMVLNLDDNVGRLLAHLENLGIMDNTMIVFMSDNGGPEYANASDNGHLRNGKGTLWEGGIRVPMAIQWTSIIPPKQVVDSSSVVSSLDLMPTFAEISGADQLQTIKTDGFNLMSLMTTQIPIRKRDLFWRRGTTMQTAIRSAGYKYYLNSKTSEEYLFNIGENDNEWGTSQIATLPDTAVQLTNKYAHWEATLPYPAWSGYGELFAITTYEATAMASTVFSETLTISTDETNLTWSILSGKPDWLSLDALTGVISGTPLAADAGDIILALQVTDGTKLTTYALPITVLVNKAAPEPIASDSSGGSLGIFSLLALLLLLNSVFMRGKR